MSTVESSYSKSIFDIKTEWKTASNNLVHPFMVPLVGDLNGDGFPEIVVGGAYKSNAFLGYGTDCFYIFDGIHREHSICVPTPYGISSYATSALALARGKLHHVSTALIIVAGMDRLLHAYNASGAEVWTSTQPFVTSSSKKNGNNSLYSLANASVSVADINNDGIPEIVVLNSIYSFDGTQLIPYSATHNTGGARVGNNQFDVYQGAIANMDSDPQLEFVAGNTVYDIELNNLKGSEGNRLVPLVTLKGFPDGRTSVADVDNDGDLDVIVGSTNPNLLYIWEGQDSILMCSKQRKNVALSVPAVGDINGDGIPEIVVCTKEKSGNSLEPYLMYAFQYNGKKQTLDELWQLNHSDASACTGMSMFDFHGNGYNEICYRDQNNLRIINGSLKSPSGNDTCVYTVSSIPCGSATTFEYPVVADVDSDGAADIIVTGDPDVANKTEGAALLIYGGGASHPWQNARPVWNQYAYYDKNVNNDLSLSSQKELNTCLTQGVTLPVEKQPLEINLMLQQDTLNEGEDVILFAHVTSDVPVKEDVVIYLLPSSESTVSFGEYYYPSTIIIPKDSTSAYIRVQAYNDEDYEGYEYIVFSPQLNPNQKDYRLIALDTFTVVVRDECANPNGGASFTFQIDSDEVHEGSEVHATIQLKGAEDTEHDQYFNMYHAQDESEDSDIEIPKSVVMLAGTRSVKVSIPIFEDHILEGNEEMHLEVKPVNRNHVVIPSVDSFLIVDMDMPEHLSHSIVFDIEHDTIWKSHPEKGQTKMVAYLSDGMLAVKDIHIFVSEVFPDGEEATRASTSKPKKVNVTRDTITIKRGENRGSETITALYNETRRGADKLVLKARIVSTYDSTEIDCRLENATDSVILDEELDTIEDPDTIEKLPTSLYFNISKDTLLEGDSAFMDCRLNGDSTDTSIEIAFKFLGTASFNSDYKVEHSVVLSHSDDTAHIPFYAIQDGVYGEPVKSVVVTASFFEPITFEHIELKDTVYIVDTDTVPVPVPDTLNLALSKDSISEGEDLFVEVSLSNKRVADHDILVTLAYTHSDQCQMPCSLVIKKGSNAGRVELQALHDQQYDEEDEWVFISAIADRSFMWNKSAESFLLLNVPKPVIVPHLNISAYVHSAEIALCDSNTCDIDLPYVHKRFLGLDTQKNHLEVEIQEEERGSTLGQEAKITLSGVDPKLYTTNIHSGLYTYFNKGRIKLDIIHGAIPVNIPQLLTVEIEVANKKFPPIEVLFSRDFDDDGIDNIVERNTCLKTTDNIPNEWYFYNPNADDDDDGIVNSQEGPNPNPYLNDDDSDCIPNFKDVDSDNDGVPDVVEKFSPRKKEHKQTDVYVNPALSPNNDGLGNEFMYIDNINKYPNNNVTLFDVGGNVVYNVKGYDNKNKVFNGFPNLGAVQRKVAQGIYYYIVEYIEDKTNEKKQVTGFVEVRY